MNTRLLCAWWPALIGSIIFVTSAILLIPYPGLQEDELIFAPSIFNPGMNDHMTLGRHIIPRMLLSYMGATKTWLYFAIFKLWSPSLYSVRVPAILLYALTIWVFYDVHLAWVRVSAHGGDADEFPFASFVPAGAGVRVPGGWS
jgi:hypothetical protein